MVGGVLEANKRWDIGKEVINCILKTYPGATLVRPKVSTKLKLLQPPLAKIFIIYCSCVYIALD